jgi:pimeloyl-ACP methyl ester carboxylesterase
MSKAAANYLGLVAFAAPLLAAPALESADLMIPARDAGIELHLRNRHPAQLEQYAADRVVLFVHGATFPGSSTFDTELPGGSWMRYVAERGYDAYALDIRGYGASTRPVAMSQPPASNAPFAGTREAVRDIGAAVDYILARRKITSLTLVGWSWGTTTTAAFAGSNPARIGKLVLVAPVWLGVQPPKYQGAWRSSTRESARAFAMAGLPPAKVDEISPLSNFDAWWKATLATDAEGARQSPPVVRSPNGVLQDFSEIWAAGKTAYDPADIRAPTLLVVGEWDAITPPAMAFGLYSKLTSARERRLVLMSEGTHFMIIEKHRLRLLGAVQNFLDASD